jgi:cytochrome c oxidase subunit 2
MRSLQRAARMSAATAAGVLGGCAGPQSTLDPHGPVAGGIARTWWLMAGAAALVLLLVVGLALYATLRDPARRRPLPANALLAGGGVLLPALLLGALLVHGTALGRRITQQAEAPVRIEVTGHRWWWEVRYPPGLGPGVLTANELHVPVGMPVEIVLTSADVIHSFWIPSLAGKLDMVPGMLNTLRLTAGKAGRFRLQCAEFCGPQHARMGMWVVAQPPQEFTAWLRARAAPAAPAPAALGRFAALGCAQCHRIDGTDAAGSGGPVLTHLAGRPSLGAGTAPLDATTLRAWLADHGRSMKPGSTGPAARTLHDQDVQQLASMLEALL